MRHTFVHNQTESHTHSVVKQVPFIASVTHPSVSASFSHYHEAQTFASGRGGLAVRGTLVANLSTFLGSPMYPVVCEDFSGLVKQDYLVRECLFGAAHLVRRSQLLPG